MQQFLFCFCLFVFWEGLGGGWYICHVFKLMCICLWNNHPFCSILSFQIVLQKSLCFCFVLFCLSCHTQSPFCLRGVLKWACHFADIHISHCTETNLKALATQITIYKCIPYLIHLHIKMILLLSQGITLN